MGTKTMDRDYQEIGRQNYDGNTQNIKMFLDRLADRVAVSRRESISCIQGKDLITQYSIISMHR